MMIERVRLAIGTMCMAGTMSIWAGRRIQLKTSACSKKYFSETLLIDRASEMKDHQ